jgi:hypothetical protein
MFITDIERLNVKPVTTNNDATAASTGDNTKVTGDSIIKSGYDACLLSILGTLTVADTETLSFAVEIQDSADGASWNTATSLKSATVVHTSSGGDTDQSFTVPLEVDVSDYDEYIRFNITPDLSASSTDTVNWGALAILGNGSDLVESHTFTATTEA